MTGKNILPSVNGSDVPTYNVVLMWSSEAVYLSVSRNQTRLLLVLKHHETSVTKFTSKFVKPLDTV